MSGDEGDDAHRRANGNGLLAQAPARIEKPASSINCKDFRSDIDDFEQWVTKFERAVKLATNVRDNDQLYYLYKEWLPLKLDEAAYAIWLQTTKTRWPDLREELISLLVDPQEKYKWQAKLTTIKWDGKESFHALASRVKRAVDKYDKEMSQDYKNREYFFRFRAAFKKPMRRCIDMGCSENNRTIEAAKDIVLRYQITTADDDGNNPTDTVDLKGATFSNADFHLDQAANIEMSLAEITTKLDNLAFALQDIGDRLSTLEMRVRDESDRRRGIRGSRNHGESNNHPSRSNRSYRNNHRDNRRSNDRGSRRDDYRENDRNRNYEEDDNRSFGNQRRNQNRNRHHDDEEDESSNESDSDEEAGAAGGNNRRY